MNKNNRWFVVFGAVLLQICVGAIYTWSLFNKPFSNKFGWHEKEIVFAFAITVFMFAFATLFSGPLQDKKGPRFVASIGGILYALGLILTSTATSLYQLYAYYGVIVGLGVGFVYVCPLTTCLKWFPNHKGLITGISLGAFGSGGLIFKPVIEYLIANFGVSATFLYKGVIFLILILVGAQFLKVPETSNKTGSSSVDISLTDNNYTVGAMVKTKQFYLLWIILLLGTLSGLLVIGLAKDIGIELAGLEPAVAANAVAIIALFNTAGRLVLGSLSDKIGRLRVILITFILTAVSMGYMSAFSLNYITYMVSLALITLSFGGILAVYPTVTGEFYGLKSVGANYSIIFQAYGIAALVGPIIAGQIGNLRVTFAIAGVLSVIGAMLTTKVKAPLKS